jgi:ribosome biogenesis GTPase / thiamine phosphate phosphatase
MPPKRKKPNSDKKLRVSFRKNRDTRGRTTDITRAVQSGAQDVEELAHGERVSGRGQLTRKRTVAGATTDGEHIILEIDEAACIQGRVISAIGSTQCVVQADDRQRYHCTVRRVVQTIARDARSAVVTGDRVWVRPGPPEVVPGQSIPKLIGVIERVEPRQGVLARGHQYQQHIIVANITQVLIVGSADQPPFKPALIDRFLVSAGKGGVDAIICITKADLIDPVELQPLIGLYSRLGYQVVLTSVQTGYGIARLKELLKDQQTVFTGQSGVGKSTLLNAIQPGLALKTGDVSKVHQKGRHTTRYAELIELEHGGWVVDTPGIRQLGLWDVSKGEVEGYFVEFRPFVPMCRFPNCIHMEETDCAVRMAVQMDLISRLRYESYLRIVLGDEG